MKNICNQLKNIDENTKKVLEKNSRGLLFYLEKPIYTMNKFVMEF